MELLIHFLEPKRQMATQGRKRKEEAKQVNRTDAFLHDQEEMVEKKMMDEANESREQATIKAKSGSEEIREGNKG